MMHTVPGTARVAPWPLPSGWHRFGQAVTAGLGWLLRLCGLGSDMPELRMSRDWLDEHERQSRKHAGDV